MSQLSNLRAHEKELQGELANVRRQIAVADAKIEPLRASLRRKTEELSALQRTIISALQSKLDKADAA